MEHAKGKHPSPAGNGGVSKPSGNGWDQYRRKDTPAAPSTSSGTNPQLPMVSTRGSGGSGVKPARAPGGNLSGGSGVKPSLAPGGSKSGKSKGKHPRFWRRFWLAAGILAILLLAYGLWRFFWAPEPGVETPVGQAVTGLLQRNDKGESIRTERVEEQDEKPFPLLAEVPDLPPLVSTSAINLLVMARDVEANLYDTLLIISMNPEDGAVRLINIPRDLFVNYSDEAVSRISKKLSGLQTEPALRKINAAHKLGKLIAYREDNSRFGSPDYDFTADLIEEMFQLSIDDFVFIRHESFQQIVEEFGGVEVDVPRGMRYNDPIQKLHINLQPGLQLLDGVEAEGFVRFRKGYDQNGKYYEIGDLGRKENQNLFVKAFMEQHLTLGNLSNIVSLANRYTEFVETSVVGQSKIYAYTQIGKSLIAEHFAITPVTLETEFQKILGSSHLVLAGGIAHPPQGSGTGTSGTKTSGETAASTTNGSVESVQPESGETITVSGIDMENPEATEPADGPGTGDASPDGTGDNTTNPDGTDGGIATENPDGTDGGIATENPDGADNGNSTENPDSADDGSSTENPEGVDDGTSIQDPDGSFKRED